MLNGDIEVAGLLRGIAQRSPTNALMLDPFTAIRVYRNAMSPPRKFSRTTNDARLRTPERTRFEIATVVSGGNIGNDYARHGCAARLPKNQVRTVCA
jgi:hypothetical protein